MYCISSIIIALSVLQIKVIEVSALPYIRFF